MRTGRGLGVVGRYPGTNSAICPRASYAMPDTDIASGGIRLRACYAMPNTEIAYGIYTHTHVLRDARL
eukprot:3191361-Rhodomonas_salina.5